MNINIKGFLIGLLIGAGITFALKQCSREIIEVPVTVEVKVPVIEVQHDTVYSPVPYIVKEADTSLVSEYKKANDSLKQKLYESAVTNREYKEVFDDSIQTITVGAKVTGTLNSLSVGYKTKPRTIKVDTTIFVKVPSIKRSLSPYMETGVPTQIGENQSIVFKAGIDYSDKKGWIYGVSYDTDKKVWLKLGKRFNF